MAIRVHLTLAAASVALLAAGACDGPITDPQSPNLAVSLDARGSGIVVEEPVLVPVRDRPLTINNRGWVLTSNDLSTRSGVTRLVPDFYPTGMSDRLVVGRVSSGGCPSAATLDPTSGEVVRYPTPSGYDAGLGFGVSSSGTVVGWAGRRNTAPRCEILHTDVVIWDGGQATVLPPLRQGESSTPHAINSRGTVGGTSGGDATVWHDGEAIRIGRFGGEESRVLGLNDRGQAVGFSETGDRLGGAPIVAFLWEGGLMMPLDLLGGHTAFARDINNRGLIAGSATNASFHERAVVWYRGQISDLGTLGGLRSGADGVNDLGEVVGWAEDALGDVHTVIWRVHVR